MADRTGKNPMYCEPFCPLMLCGDTLPVRRLQKDKFPSLFAVLPSPLTDKLHWVEYLAAKENLFPDIPSESLYLREQSAADPGGASDG